MNYTTNYHLPQWDETDRIMRTDFNQMCADMEAGLLKTARDAAAGITESSSGAAAAAASAAADAASAAADAAAAQATADQAVAAAAAAQATANAAYCPTNLPYVIGSYTGNNTTQTITVGFQPRFLIISHSADTDAHLYFLAAGNNMNSARLEFTATGFKLFEAGYDYTHTVCSPIINSSGKTYVYIAFR